VQAKKEVKNEVQEKEKVNIKQRFFGYTFDINLREDILMTFWQIL
jgi:hypothetical protein